MITISEAAADQLKEMLAAQEVPNMFLRLGVSAGGCSGFSYAMGFDDHTSDQDEFMEIQGMKIAVAKDDLRMLDGVEIDYEAAGMTGGFTINNPNAIATCGCGQSFRTRKEEESLAQPCED
ncbi:iron-sulfur cluster assembly accessory protein [Paenibacillus spiritus]|uniref:Iron-sulfur cluster assembly accessory protein n=1 Tax=Paenibacillus spiritus TaxID=2496557 RepID=A0A5J5GKG4_9BACL|nr:iron-sulfur cluster assembly accessory protein [Paenibacillus spiritus]KAA9008610.1 iron-sulfur cluster assembly accessory protein [Paenibacillus spiritus]